MESNLVPLCKKCHTDVHNNKLQIDGYKQTSKGIKLQYKEVPTEQFADHKQSRKKYDTEIVEFIKQLKTGSKLSNKNLKIILQMSKEQLLLFRQCLLKAQDKRPWMQQNSLI